MMLRMGLHDAANGLAIGPLLTARYDDGHDGKRLSDFWVDTHRAWQRARQHQLGRALPAECPLTLTEVRAASAVHAVSTRSVHASP